MIVTVLNLDLSNGKVGRPLKNGSELAETRMGVTIKEKELPPVSSDRNKSRAH